MREVSRAHEVQSLNSGEASDLFDVHFLAGSAAVF